MFHAPLLQFALIYTFFFDPLRQAGKLGPETSNFWLLVRALGEFVEGEGEGLPPLSGEVRDTGAWGAGAVLSRVICNVRYRISVMACYRSVVAFGTLTWTATEQIRSLVHSPSTSSTGVQQHIYMRRITLTDCASRRDDVSLRRMSVNQTPFFSFAQRAQPSFVLGASFCLFEFRKGVMVLLQQSSINRLNTSLS